MKTSLLAATLLALLVLGTTRDLQAQASGLYYYGSYWDAVQYDQHLHYQQYLQQNDPYYELHVMHYQLYLHPYQPYQVYQPCCHAWPVVIPQSSTTISSHPQTATSRRGQAAVSSLPHAVSSLPPPVSPLPRAVSSLPQATNRR